MEAEFRPHQRETFGLVGERHPKVLVRPSSQESLFRTGWYVGMWEQN